MPPETTKTLTTIRNSGARLLNLINDILDAAALRKVRPGVPAGAHVMRMRRLGATRCSDPPHHGLGIA